MTRRVVHAVDRFLPRSETFIYTVVTGHHDYEASVVARLREHAAEFPFPRVHLTGGPGSRMSVAWWVDASLKRATGRTRWERRVESILRALGPDVVHAHFGPVGCDFADLAAGLGIPMVTSLYGVDAAVLPYLPQWRDRYARLFRTGDRFLAEGPEMRLKIIAAGAPADRTVIQPIAIKLGKYPRWAPEQPVTVLFAGRFVEKKGLCDAIAAFGLARPRVPSARMVIVGNGPDEDDARALAGRLGLADVVQFVGPKPHDDLIRRLAAATVLIHPSRTAADGDSEGGAPTILLEAQAIGTPIVTTRHADIPHVAPAAMGVHLCDERDVPALGEALVTAIGARTPTSPAHVAAHHEAGVALARLEAIYEELASRGAASQAAASR